MGFRNDGYMTVWEVEENRTGSSTIVRLTSSKKNKRTNAYEQDFSGYCLFIGDAHAKAGGLQPKDRIKIIECEVSNNYDKKQKREYTYYKVYNFDMLGGKNSERDTPRTSSGTETKKRTAFAADEGEVDEEVVPF